MPVITASLGIPLKSAGVTTNPCVVGSSGLTDAVARLLSLAVTLLGLLQGTVPIEESFVVLDALTVILGIALR